MKVSAVNVVAVVLTSAAVFLVVITFWGIVGWGWSVNFRTFIWGVLLGLWIAVTGSQMNL